MRLLWLAVAASLVAGAVRAADREVTLDGGVAPLHGSLLVPDRPAKGAAVLMLEGSGASDRNANGPPGMALHTDAGRMIAEGLAARGITSLRVDKRCIGESRPACPSEDRLRLQTYVDDTVAWVRFLHGQPGVKCVVIYGHSEGALIAALAAARTPVCGLVSASGVGRSLATVLHDQYVAAGVNGPTLAKIDEILAALTAGRAYPDPPPALKAVFRPSIQPYLISEFSVDPTRAVAGVKAPVLVIQGDHDVQVSVEDARRLAAARRGAKLLIVPGMSHVMKPAPAERAANLATYADPSLPLSPQVVPAIAAFVQQAGKGGWLPSVPLPSLPLPRL